MCGRELIGRVLEDGRIQYTDWGNLSVEIHMGYFKHPLAIKGERVSLALPTAKEGRNLGEELLEWIVKDTKGTLPLEDYKALGDADCVWVLKDDTLWDPKRDRFLTF